jgi:hypothetical protein
MTSETPQAGPADDAARDATGGGTVVLLTEEPLHGPDVDRLLALHPAEDGGPEWAYWVVVPQDTQRNLLAEFVDQLGLGRLREAFATVHDPAPDAAAARSAAAEVLATTLAALRERGRGADGLLTADDPLPAVRDAVEQHGADEVVVVSRPRLLEDTFHRDWASRARDALGVPVLHVYGGTTSVG